MTRKFRDPNKIPSSATHACQHPLTVTYVPDPNDVDIQIDESSSDVKTCNSTARYVLHGVHYCDRHYQQVITRNSEEYSEYDDPADLGHTWGD
jgi:hypothetical protein